MDQNFITSASGNYHGKSRKEFQGFQVIKGDEPNLPKNPVENSNSITKTMQIKKDFRRNPQGDLQKDCMEIPLHPGEENHSQVIH